MPGVANRLIATILNGQSESQVVPMLNHKTVAIRMPSAWTAAALTFIACDADGNNEQPVYDDAGAEVSITSANVVAGRTIVLSGGTTNKLAGLDYLKVRSGVAATPVTQGADRVLTLILKS